MLALEFSLLLSDCILLNWKIKTWTIPAPVDFSAWYLMTCINNRLGILQALMWQLLEIAPSELHCHAQGLASSGSVLFSHLTLLAEL